LQPDVSKTAVVQQANAAAYKELADLCAAMSGCGKSPECIGALLDSEQNAQYPVHAQPEPNLSVGDASFKDVL